MRHVYNKLLTLSFSNNYNPDWIYNGEKTARLTSSCVLAAGFVSHRFTQPPSTIPESGKGRGELDGGDLFSLE
jgi:hypothetical protein